MAVLITSLRAAALTAAVAFACAGCRSGGAVAPRTAAPSPSASASAVNHPPAIRARCQPCSVPPGGTAALSAEAQDPDGDALVYAWSASAGSLSNAASSTTPWTAPAAPGPVPVTVRVSDGKGGIASDVVTLTVGAR